MNWNVTTWMQNGHGPYHLLRIYAGREDSDPLEKKIRALIGDNFPSVRIKKRSSNATGYPEYYIYLGRSEVGEQLAAELDTL